MSMQPDASNGHDAPGLPTVTPPSGKFIAQLFLIPGLIVVGVVGVIWFVTWLVGGFFTPESFLEDLRSPNPEVRWRRASDLAQFLTRDDQLASNPKFALDLADLLQDSFEDSPRVEREGAERARSKTRSVTERTEPFKGDVFTEEQSGAEDPTLRHERNYLRFLISCNGHFVVPASAPVLGEIATAKPEGVPADVTLRRQRLAVFALANLGENLKRFDRLPAPDRDRVLTELHTEIEKAGPARRQRARQTFELLEARAAGKHETIGIDKTLIQSAGSDDPMLRKFTAMALTFWRGNPEENARMEEALVKLTQDDGHGSTEQQPQHALEIRFQAVRGLAERGSSKTPVPLIGEMLDQPRLEEVLRARVEGRDVGVDAPLVASVLTSGLKCVTALARNKTSLDLSKLVPAIEKLTQSDNRAVRTEAERTLLALKS
ncbi:MAG: hypothetical protein AB7K24_02460 [Gemmataceae bacterium]